MRQEVKSGDIVIIEYTGKLENGLVFMSSEEDGNLQFEVGTYSVIPGLNNSVIGMKEGESRRITLPPSEAFGEHDEQLFMNVAIADLPDVTEVGMQLRGESEDGEESIWTVRAIEDGVAQLDGNHILAGKKVILDVTVRGIRNRVVDQTA